MWWKHLLRGFWNGITAWFVLIAHALGAWRRHPLFDTTRRSNWYALGFLLGAASFSVKKQDPTHGKGGAS